MKLFQPGLKRDDVALESPKPLDDGQDEGLLQTFHFDYSSDFVAVPLAGRPAAGARNGPHQSVVRRAQSANIGRQAEYNFVCPSIVVHAPLIGSPLCILNRTVQPSGTATENSELDGGSEQHFFNMTFHTFPDGALFSRPSRPTTKAHPRMAAVD